MNTNLEIFEKYDKNQKKYLTKHEFKVALIFVLGYKLRYDEIKKIWQARLQFKNQNDINLVSEGITFEYFDYIKEKLIKQMKPEKRLLLDFKAIDQENKNQINYEDFTNLLEESNLRFLTQAKKIEIFNSFDLDKDGQISYIDFQNAFNLSAIDIE